MFHLTRKWCLVKRGLANNWLALAGGGLLALCPLAALADDYVVGMTAAMTGPASATYAPVAEAIRAYVTHLNGRGGVNGKQVKLGLHDQQIFLGVVVFSHGDIFRGHKSIPLIDRDGTFYRTHTALASQGEGCRGLQMKPDVVFCARARAQLGAGLPVHNHIGLQPRRFLRQALHIL